MDINKQTLKQFRVSFAKAVMSLEEEYEVKVNMRNISFGDVSFTAKVEVTNGANPEEVARNSFEQDLKNYGTWFPEITMEHFEKGLMYLVKRVKVVGFKPRSPKYPIIYKAENGRNFKASYESIKHFIATQN